MPFSVWHLFCCCDVVSARLTRCGTMHVHFSKHSAFCVLLLFYTDGDACGDKMYVADQALPLMYVADKALP